MKSEFNSIEKTLLKYVNKFCFQRLAGTSGEKKAVELTIATFKELGYAEENIKKEDFLFSTFYSSVLIKIFAFMTLIMVITLLFIKYIFTYIIFFTFLLMIVISISLIKVLKHPEVQKFWEKHFGKKITASNVFVKVLASKAALEKSGNIIISAHLDSKSQSFKTMWRVIFSLIWLFGGLFLSVLYLFFIIDYHNWIDLFVGEVLIIESLIVILSIVIIFSNIVFLFFKTKNESKGALDNASGMAIVFDLSSYFNKNPLENYNLWFCVFSAEELGTMGSRNFLDKYIQIFKKGNTFQFNFDMVSVCNSKKNRVEFIKSYGFIPKKKIAPILKKKLKQSASQLNVELIGFDVPIGAHTDSIPFHLKKFDSVDITTRCAAKYTHSKENTIDKVDSRVLTEAFLIVKNSILLFDKEKEKFK